MTEVFRVRRLSKGQQAPVCARAKPGAGHTAFTISVDDHDVCTVFGVDQHGNDVDISGLATLTASSDNTAIMTIDNVAGVQFTMRPAGPTGLANAAVVVTWNDHSIGPFSASMAVTWTNGAITGIDINPGPPQPGP